MGLARVGSEVGPELLTEEMATATGGYVTRGQRLALSLPDFVCINDSWEHESEVGTSAYQK